MFIFSCSSRPQASRIPVPSGRLSVSSVDVSEDEDPAKGDNTGTGLSKRQRFAWSSPSLNTDCEFTNYPFVIILHYLFAGY